MGAFIVVETPAPEIISNTTKEGCAFRFPTLSIPHRRRWRIKTNGYRESVSFNCFFFGCKQRNYTKKKNGVMYYASWEDEYQRSAELYKKSGLEDMDQPIVDVSDLWEFYKLIGYDYKKQKWLT